MNKRILTVALILAAFAAVGAVLAIRASSSNEQPPTAMARARVATDALPADAAAAAVQRGLAPDRSRRIAADTYLVPTSNAADLCLVSIANDEMRSSCNGSGRFFSGHQIVFTIAEQGAPGALAGLTITGVARPTVSQVQVTFPGGKMETATPSEDGGFVLAASTADVTAGEPTAIAALDAQGRVVENESGPTS